MSAQSTAAGLETQQPPGTVLVWQLLSHIFICSSGVCRWQIAKFRCWYTERRCRIWEWRFSLKRLISSSRSVLFLYVVNAFLFININIRFHFCFLTERQIVQVCFTPFIFLFYCYHPLFVIILNAYFCCCRNESSTSSLDRNDTLYSRGYGESRRTYSSRLDRDDTTDYKKVWTVCKALHVLLLELI